MRDTKHPPAAIAQAGILSYITFQWIQPLILYGKTHILKEDDLQRLSENDRIERLSDLMFKEWTAEVEQKRAQAETRGQKMKRPNLYKVLWRCFGLYFCVPTFVGVTESVFKISEAVLLGYVIRFFDTPSMTMNQGMGYAVGLFLLTLFHGLIHHHNYFHTLRIGTWTRQSLISLMYRKCLTLSTSSSISTGTVVNMISNDVQPFENCSVVVMFIVLGPLEAIVIMYFLWRELEEACFAGLLAFGILMPIQAFFSRRFARVRAKTVEARDERIRTLSDVFSGIELVKLCAWEVPFQEKVMMLRSIEVRHIWTANSMRAMNLSIWAFFQSVIAVFMFVTYWLQGKTLTPDKVFVSLTLFNVLRQTMTLYLPQALETLAEVRVSTKRIVDFLLLPELKSIEDEPKSPFPLSDMMKDHRDDSQLTLELEQIKTSKAKAVDSRQDYEIPDVLVEMKDASFSWTIAIEEDNEILEMCSKERQKQTRVTSKEKNNQRRSSSPVDTAAVENNDSNTRSSPKKAILKNVTMTLRKDELLAIVGPVGSGKSSFCMALLKELPIVSGSMVQANRQLSGSRNLQPLAMSYSAQSPWIFAGSIRTNILFGSMFDQDRYDRVIKACELTRDLTLFPQGDATLIGEKGVTLSGGQRARVSLARAAYRDSDIYILDDPLSAVDPKVGRALFENCINGLLKDKARVLVTHQLQYIKDCENVIVFEQGQVTHTGRVDDVMQEEVVVESVVNDGISARSVRMRAKFVDVLREFSKKAETTEVVDDTTTHEKVDAVTSEVEEESSRMNVKAGYANDDEASVAEKNLTIEEIQEGETTMKSYVDFLRIGSPWPKLILTAVCLSSAQAIVVGGGFFLTVWSGKDATEQKRSYYPTTFGLYALGTVIMTIIRSFLFFDCVTASARNIFASMMESLMRTTLDFFHANPHGRVLNRFSKDMATCDELLPKVFYDTIQVGFMLLGSIVTVCIVNPWIVIAVPFILGAFAALRSLYIKASRQVKRIDSQTRSPIYSHLSETLDGLSSVRAFGVSRQFMEEQMRTQEDNGRPFFLYLAMARWLGLRLDAVSAVFLGITAISCTAARDSQQAARAGLAMSSIIGLSGELQWAVRMSVEAAILMVSVERMMEYTTVKPEESDRHLFNPDGSSVVPNGWPSEAKVTFTDMSLTYPRGDGPVLKNISLDFRGSEKIAIVGRTGAGKSSLIGAIFRLVETTTGNPPHRGGITIDGIDISKIGMHDLRAKMAIIPQEPFLFRGTLRFNLDPTNQHQDADIWAALEAAELKRLVESLEGGLDANVDDNGKNFSIGERQLLSLARAVLRRSKIIVMDEATANVDLQSDRMIQQAIHQEFKDATVFTIAHRLNTVIDGAYDRILVLDQGQVMEFGEAWELLRDDDDNIGGGWLKGMVEGTGPENAATLRKIAKAQWEKRHSQKSI
ncbi:hypothetical protein BGZ83_007248 [Gryganskiella cystojenkinii]|nr:hypothetical protein BGZ83_007248 [Gryganskiella cystojenkinii]